MFADRQAFDVGEAHVLDIGHQLTGQCIIVEEGICVAAPPGTQVHFID